MTDRPIRNFKLVTQRQVSGDVTCLGQRLFQRVHSALGGPHWTIIHHQGCQRRHSALDHAGRAFLRDDRMLRMGYKIISPGQKILNLIQLQQNLFNLPFAFA